MSAADEPVVACSFCGKTQKQVAKLVAGPGVYICDECIRLCNEIVEEDGAAAAETPPEPTPDERRATLLHEMQTSARMFDVAEKKLRSRAKELRDLGAPWEEIGAALGIDAAAAESRFGST